ncbi:hypothetical protein RXV94_02895 [Yeosuana sp. MJ-SS3]|uniref:Uncharacterized protein n=1 Tax=Gilvirhabdus luticola TaxID=3079858 RepID=A0ABU3U3W3_9FLAO|nr:hypothetical protein [Yeosuana sp. MJ-SS3]MDU8885093.1 hypothetical protein [Yeosuana sp. MJ-SS3]
MKRERLIIIYTICVLITVYGLVSGKFLFLLFVLPLGFGFFNKNKKDN